MKFDAKVLKGSFDEKRITVTLKLSTDASIIGQMNKLIGQELQVRIGPVPVIDCTLQKGMFDEKHTSFTLSMEHGDPVIADLSRMAVGGYVTEVELHNPQSPLTVIDKFFDGMTELPGIESVTMNGHEIKSKRKSSRPKTDALLQEADGAITCVADIVKTLDEQGFELYNGRLYKHLTVKERKIVDTLDFQE